MEAELEFAIKPDTTGKQLFDQVVKTIGLREVWYFGLQYTDKDGFVTWLKLNKKVLSHDIARENKDAPYQFKFRVKFFPEDVAEELIQETTQRLFYLQVRESILTEDLYCPPETAVLLASYSVLAKYGPYNEKVHKPSFLANERLLPPRVIDQHKLTKEEWEEKIVTWYAGHKDLLREDAMMEYLKICQDLDMYGVNYFSIKNKKGTELWLGVDALGLNVYEKEDRLTPKIGFPWSEIRNIQYNDKKFTIAPIDKKAPDFIFYSPRLRINKRILALCIGNHELYMRRRKPDTIEVQSMKQQAREDRHSKQMERAQMQRERSEKEKALKDKEEAERERQKMETLLKKYEEDKSSAQEKLKRREEEAKDLEEKMRLAKQEAETIERRRQKAEEERKATVLKAQQEQAEKEALMRRAAEMEEKARQIEEESARKAREAEELQKRLDEAHKKQMEDLKKLQDISYMPTSNYTPYGDEENTAGEQSLSMEGVSNIGSELDRQTMQDKNQNMADRLKALTKDLQSIRVEAKETQADKIHAENVKKGVDKFKTLKQIRQGNTKTRVELFENM